VIKVSVLYPYSAGARVDIAEAILSDIPNYTDIEPVVRISEIMID
jgi:hypothetical protein